MKLGIHCVRTYWIRGFTAFCRRKASRSYATDVYVEQEFEMTSQPTPLLLAGHVLEISFATFTPQITVHSERH